MGGAGAAPKTRRPQQPALCLSAPHAGRKSHCFLPLEGGYFVRKPSPPGGYLGVVSLYFSLISSEIILFPSCLNATQVQTSVVGNGTPDDGLVYCQSPRSLSRGADGTGRAPGTPAARLCLPAKSPEFQEPGRSCGGKRLSIYFQTYCAVNLYSPSPRGTALRETGASLQKVI